MKLIGVDPGMKTGWAVFDTYTQRLTELLTLPPHRFFERVKGFDVDMVGFVVEDARKRKWFGVNAGSKQQGAGAIKAITTAYEMALKDYGYHYVMVHPVKGATKLSGVTFKKTTGFAGRCSQHGRDAAMLVYNMTDKMFFNMKMMTS